MHKAVSLCADGLMATTVLLAGLIVFGNVIGLSAGVGYVETKSMSPTLEPGDGFVMIPDAIAGPPQSGDVVVFEAEELRGGGPTTHRIVGQTDRGYITQGDNNNVPDQAGNEPVVQETQINGRVLQIAGSVVSIPYVGVVAEEARGYLDTIRQYINAILWRLTSTSGLSATQFSYVLTAVFISLHVVQSVRESDKRDSDTGARTRRESDGTEISTHTILLGLTGVIVVAVTAAMVVPGGAQQYDIVASESDSPVLATPGEEAEVVHGVGNSPVLPMTVFVKGGNGVRVDRHRITLDRGETANVSANLAVPDSVGHHRFYVVEHWYITVLPESVTSTLYAQHPWLPILVINTVVAIPYYLIGRAFLPTKTARDRKLRR
jgi:signal peptidase I, archaeal type